MHCSLARIAIALWIAGASSQTTASAQCLQWTPFPGSVPQINGEVRALHVHDDGSGAALYVAGDLLPPAGGARIGIRRWDGASFRDVGAGIDGVVEALATFDDGTGPALFAGGTFAGADLVRWDGATWQPIDTFAGSVYALAVFDDGSGTALYVGGSLAGAAGIARWRAGAWSSLGTGVQLTQTQPGIVRALTVGDDGSGPALYAGGSFVQAGPFAALNVARWSAGAWSSVGSGFGNTVEKLAALDDGVGPAIFAGGYFNLAGTIHSVARWNGSAWTGIRSGSLTDELAVVDDGSGPHLHRSSNLCSAASVERWDGATWTPVGPAPQPCVGSLGILAFATFDEGSGPAVFLAGSAACIGPIRCSFARRDGAEWVRVGSPLQGPDAIVRDLHVHDDGTGGVLVAAGDFGIVDDQPSERIAAWNGTGWDPLGFVSGFDNAQYALASYDAGLGNELYAGGEQCKLTRRRGAAWEFVGGSTLDPSDRISALAVLDTGSGPELYVAGSFTWFGGVPATNIVRWDGAAWRVLGTSVNGVAGAVRALQVFDDGTGPVLYVGGEFTSAGGATATRVARWDGAAWSSTPVGFAQPVTAFAVHDEGAGARLFAGTSSFSVSRVWRLSGSAWQMVGGNFGSDVLALASFHDGTSSALYAGGAFWGSSLQTLRGIARWNGSAWTSVGSGFAGGTSGTRVAALAEFDDGAGPALAAGGSFTTAGAEPARNFTTWRGCVGAISTFCYGDGTVAPCPCGNQGAPSRGCDNSSATGGAQLIATGTSAPDSLVLHGAGASSSAATLVFQGNAMQSAPTRFGDGLRCAGGQLLRLYTVTAVQGAFAVPGPGQPSLSTRAASLGDALTPGAIRGYQAWYRDPDPAFCAAPSGDVWNLSNAVRIVW